MHKVFEMPFLSASLPWKERVKLSIEKLEDGMEETRRDLLIIGKNINHMPAALYLILLYPQARCWTRHSQRAEFISRQDWSDFPGREELRLVWLGNIFFCWTLSFFSGQGNFGKVYTAINNDTGGIMAMKEIQLLPNDHKTLR